ncbi:hypothetical protein FQN50_006610 [Emmonsiellopsis sp. PD_5]|nr:hypothetical protein FQN50_006610 [Emmonsiellopsis sp. PD_5]
MAPPHELEEDDEVMDDLTSSDSNHSHIEPEDKVKEELLEDPENVDDRAKAFNDEFLLVTLDNGKAVLIALWQEGVEPDYLGVWPQLDRTPEEQYSVKVREKTITIEGSIDIREDEKKIEGRRIIPDIGEYPKLKGCFECYYKKDDEEIAGMDVYYIDDEGTPRDVDTTQASGDENGDKDAERWKFCTFRHELCFKHPRTYLVRFFGLVDFGDGIAHYTGRRTVGPIIVE